MNSDQAAEIADLYEQHALAVHRYALRRSDRETADEVTAQVFLVAWRRRSSVPEDALPWLYGVARRVLADQRRSASRRRRLGERLRSEAGHDEPGLVLEDGCLADALNRIPARDREALLLRYWEELEPGQIARVMGCSRAAMAVRLHRARLRLHRALEALADPRPEDHEHEGSCVTRTEPT
ncbi:MAG TPA: sigma-70 family RNA polymerase sigma factor [Solirubrobacteraceae bacterium]|jgi:RNA polymerase sigma-70 factor (ECF subfamily)|nr:sigma-70 family RNA polymerase sigma factor [Solirubrobacteraceae bacterium]